jgi:hypothetical protein
LAFGSLTLSDLTLESGLAKGGDADLGGGGLGTGGAIFNQGAMSLSRVTLLDNEALGGSSSGDLGGEARGDGTATRATTWSPMGRSPSSPTPSWSRA